MPNYQTDVIRFLGDASKNAAKIGKSVDNLTKEIEKQNRLLERYLKNSTESKGRSHCSGACKCKKNENSENDTND